MFDMARKTTKQELVHLGVKVPEDLKHWVEEQAEKEMLSISDVVRRALLKQKEHVEHGDV
jgi:hypothetical protein